LWDIMGLHGRQENGPNPPEAPLKQVNAINSG
jgi:hypothetical protein